MTQKSKMRKKADGLDFGCIECDDPMEVGDECYIHPLYSNEVVCEDCYDTMTNMSQDEAIDFSKENESSPISWMIDETDEEFYDHEDQQYD